MNEPQLDFGEPPRTVLVTNEKLHDFCALCTQRGIVLHGMTVERGGYRVTMNRPLEDDMKSFTVDNL